MILLIYQYWKKSNVTKIKMKIFDNFDMQPTGVLNLHHIAKWKNGAVFRHHFLIGSKRRQTYFQAKRLFSSCESRKEIGMQKLPRNREMNSTESPILTQSSICHGLIRPVILLPIFRLTDRPSGISHCRTHYIFSKQSIYKFNRAMHCNWIRGVARQRRGVEYTFPFFFTGLLARAAVSAL